MNPFMNPWGTQRRHREHEKAVEGHGFPLGHYQPIFSATGSWQVSDLRRRVWAFQVGSFPVPGRFREQIYWACRGKLPGVPNWVHIKRHGTPTATAMDMFWGFFLDILDAPTVNSTVTSALFSHFRGIQASKHWLGSTFGNCVTSLPTELRNKEKMQVLRLSVGQASCFFFQGLRWHRHGRRLHGALRCRLGRSKRKRRLVAALFG